VKDCFVWKESPMANIQEKKTLKVATMVTSYFLFVPHPLLRNLRFKAGKNVILLSIKVE